MNLMSKIYTKTGDKGQTSLFDGTRVGKNNIRVDTYGTVDELNSVIGIVIGENQKSNSKNQKYKLEIKNSLTEIQQDLFEIGAVLANPRDGISDKLKKRLVERVTSFEKYIDEMTGKMPELMNFILPGGGIAGSFLQFARAISRRTERRVVDLSKQEQVDSSIVIYFNRLSDLLFTMSRYMNFIEEEKETVWIKKL